MKYSFILSVLAITCSILSCTSNEVGDAKDVKTDAIYFDYEVWAEEGRDDVTINLQYRMGGPNGTTLVMSEPASVKLDNELLPVDSAKLTGAYYEVLKPADSFIGNHKITFTDFNNKKFEEDFEFKPISLDPDVPGKLKRGNLEFRFKGLDPVDHLRVVLIDTSFTSNDINEIMKVEQGKLVISAEKLNNVTDGPINLQFYKEKEKPIKNGTKEGGKLAINYGLKRHFILEE